jgi:RND superfamily putative drug exporter
MVFAIVFGLSMDYEVFLMSRMHEEWERTGDAAYAMRHGLASTGRVITAAAAIMVCVFASFVLGDNLTIKLFGVGLASAVFLDAFLIRAILVPAIMAIMGARAWWLPRGLDRALPRLNVDPSGAEIATEGI